MTESKSTVFTAAHYDLDRAEALLDIAIAARQTRARRATDRSLRQTPRWKPADPVGDTIVDAQRLGLSFATTRALRMVTQAVGLLRNARVILSDALDEYEGELPPDVVELDDGA